MQVANGAAEGSGLSLEPAMPLDVTNETPAAARVQLYQTQSCVFITTRILVVDFLVHRLQPSQVWPPKFLLCPSAEGSDWLAGSYAGKNVYNTSDEGVMGRLFCKGEWRHKTLLRYSKCRIGDIGPLSTEQKPGR